MVAKGDGMGEGWSGSSGLADVAITCIEWINNKVLLYSTRNCIQPIGINYNEKEHIYTCVCVCVCVCACLVASVMSHSLQP